MNNDIIIVGAGISGLTAAAYLSQNNQKVTLIEKSDTVGGLVGSFERNGFTFDHGIRATENSGVLFPMLRELGISVPFLKNTVSLAIENQRIELLSADSLSDYQTLLTNLFPEEKDSILKIINLIKDISRYMDVLYGVDNPLFLDPKKDGKYMLKTILPWMFKYLMTIKKIQKLNLPVNPYLSEITQNQSLIDMITQHFFKDTPTFFALSYFRIYTDYYYPKGGTQTLINALKDKILQNGGVIKTMTTVDHIDVATQTILCSDNSHVHYSSLLWAANLKNLYTAVQVDGLKDFDIPQYMAKKANILSAVGNESIFTVYLSTTLPKTYFNGKCSEHTFFTPVKAGLSTLSLSLPDLLSKIHTTPFSENKALIWKWLKEYAQKTTYEISIPVLRDETLAPEGQSALIISMVFDYALTAYLNQHGLYEAFKTFFTQQMIAVLSDSIFPGLQKALIDQFSSSPLTIKNRFGNSEGAITGWSFSSQPPVVDQLTKIAQSVKTPFPHIYQSGQWVFSPSGLPTAIITAKLAVNQLLKEEK